MENSTDLRFVAVNKDDHNKEAAIRCERFKVCRVVSLAWEHRSFSCPILPFFPLILPKKLIEYAKGEKHS
jgi:hypothetical protein